MRRFAKTAALLVVGLLLLVFAIANRQSVIFTVDPTGSTDPNSPLAFKLPLFVLSFILLIFGVIVGGAAAWLRQHKWRKASRELETELAAARAENQSLRQELAAARAAAVPAVVPPIALQPPG